MNEGHLNTFRQSIGSAKSLLTTLIVAVTLAAMVYSTGGQGVVITRPPRGNFEFPPLNPTPLTNLTAGYPLSPGPPLPLPGGGTIINPLPPPPPPPPPPPYVPSTRTNLVAYLNGACALPPNNSPYSGTALLGYDLSSYNPTNNTAVTCRVDVPPEMAPTSAGIYGPAGPGQPGPLLFDLGQPAYHYIVFCIVTWPNGESCFTNVSYYFTNSFSLTPEQMNDLNSGRLYVNVTSAAFPGGELRGQLTGSDVAVLSRFHRDPASGCSFSVTAPPNTGYQVQASTNFTSWFPLTNVITTNCVFQVLDRGALHLPGRSYRVRSFPVSEWFATGISIGGTQSYFDLVTSVGSRQPATVRSDVCTAFGTNNTGTLSYSWTECSADGRTLYTPANSPSGLTISASNLPSVVFSKTMGFGQALGYFKCLVKDSGLNQSQYTPVLTVQLEYDSNQ